MKLLTRISLMLLLLIILFAPNSVSAEETGEYYSHFESDKYVGNVLGCEMINTDNGDYVFVYFQFINMQSESKSPLSVASIKVYQNGIQLESGYVSSRVFEPEGYVDEMTSIRPNASANFYKTFKLRNSVDPIEIEMGEMFSLNRKPVECLLELNSQAVKPEEVYYSTVEPAELHSKYAELETRIAELEITVADLLKRTEKLEIQDAETGNTKEQEAPETESSEADGNNLTINPGKLTVATSPDYAPYEFYAVDEDGNYHLEGFDIALAEYIADYLGFELEILPVEFDNVVERVREKTVDLAISGLGPDPVRKEAMDFSEVYYPGEQSFVCLKENKDLFNSLEDTNNKEYEIGAQIGSFQSDLAEEYSPDADIIKLGKITDIVEELLSGKLDGAYFEASVARYYVKSYPDLVDAITFSTDTSEGAVVGVYKDNASLLKQVNEAIRNAKEDGSMDRFVVEALELAAGEIIEGLPDEELFDPYNQASSEYQNQSEQSDIIEEEENESVITIPDSSKEVEKCSAGLTENEFDFSSGEPIVLYDGAEASIILKSIEEDNIWGYTWNLLLENKSDSIDLMFSADDVVVNGFACDPYWATSLDPGKKTNTSLSWNVSQFENAGIEDVTSVEMTLKASDSNDWTAEDLFNVKIKVYPQGKDAAEESEITQKGDYAVLLDSDSLFVAVTGSSYDDIWGYGLNIYLENKLDKPTTVSIENVSVNGYMCDPFWATSIPAKAKMYQTINWADRVFDKIGFDAEQITLNSRVYFVTTSPSQTVKEEYPM